MHKSTGDHTYDEMESSLRDWLFGCNPWGTSNDCRNASERGFSLRSAFIPFRAPSLPAGWRTCGWARLQFHLQESERDFPWPVEMNTRHFNRMWLYIMMIMPTIQPMNPQWTERLILPIIFLRCRQKHMRNDDNAELLNDKRFHCVLVQADMDRNHAGNHPNATDHRSLITEYNSEYPSRVHCLLYLTPGNKLNMIITEQFFETVAHYQVKVLLPPG